MIFTGCLLGRLIGLLRKYKGNIKVFIRVLVVAISSITLSGALFKLLIDKSIIYILLLNACTLSYCVYFIVKSEKQEDIAKRS